MKIIDKSSKNSKQSNKDETVVIIECSSGDTTNSELLRKTRFLNTKFKRTRGYIRHRHTIIIRRHRKHLRIHQGRMSIDGPELVRETRSGGPKQK